MEALLIENSTHTTSQEINFKQLAAGVSYVKSLNHSIEITNNKVLNNFSNGVFVDTKPLHLDHYTIINNRNEYK